MRSDRELEVHEPLPADFYDRDVITVARELLGKLLVRHTAEGLAIGRIVEVEAYLSRDDAANHAFRGQTRRNAAMFGPPGRAYVYPIHARFCLNAVTEPPGVPSAVLIRAVEPTAGVELMQRRRGVERLRDLARGPARLCEAFSIDRDLDGNDLTRAESVWISADRKTSRAPNIATGTRVGVTSAQELPLRFFLADSEFVSRRARDRRRTPDA